MALDTLTASATLPTSAPQWKYGVFLHFNGIDSAVRRFTSYLDDELQVKQIKTFNKENREDRDTETGSNIEAIKGSIIEAIKESRFAIIVLSNSYAHSRRCLEELTQIVQCMEIKETIILPVFYEVDPCDVRNERKSFKDAFSIHQERLIFEMKRVMQWREALRKVGNIFGWVSIDFKSERELVHQIVQFVSKPIEIDSTEDIDIITRQAMDRTAPRWKYDVFLNFRGEDTRKGFLSHLQAELQKTPANLNIFKDDEQLEKGRNMSPYLLKAIEESRFAIVVLSQNFASSRWCLEELAKIFECMGNQNRILPIFYHVDPSDVRHQGGSFAKAFFKLEERIQLQDEKVKRWRDVLSMVGNLSGWSSNYYEYERELIKDVVKDVCSRLVQSTESTEDFEATGDVMDRT